jgi:hypothetical protein
MADTVMIREAPAIEGGREGSYVDWPCALAGSVIAAALSFVLFTFGSGIGLSMVSPWAGAGSSMVKFAILASLFAVLVQVGAFAAGGYVAGRMRRPWKDAKADEVEYRDGVHGALVWAVGVALGASLLATTAGGAARTAADAGGMAAGRSNGVSAETMFTIDKLLRSSKPRTEAERLADARADNRPDLTRGEVERLLAANLARGEMVNADRVYLAQLIAGRTGLSEPEAAARIDSAVVTVKATADRARKTGILAAFLAAASLLAGLVAAWNAAMIGGTHRDQGILWKGFARRDFPSPVKSAPRV